MIVPVCVAAFGSRSTISGWAAISPSPKSSRFAHHRVHRRLDYPASLGLDRLYSAIYLDRNDATLSAEVKSRVVSRVKSEFGMDVDDGDSKDAAARDRRRRDAFLLCRRALIQDKMASYAEQFEGLYALMRGLSAACVLGAINHAGWASSRAFPARAETALQLIIFLGLFLLLFFGVIVRETPMPFYVIVGLSFALGAVSGLKYAVGGQITPPMSATLFGITLFLFFVAREMFMGERRFAGLFAATVYRDFCARPSPPTKSA